MFLRLSIVIGLVVAGCTAPRPRASIVDEDASVKIRGIRRSVSEQDRAALGPLIDQLDSDDPAVRLYAIEALQRLTGQDLGYRYYDDELERRPAIQRWRQWLGDGSPGDAPTSP